MDGILNFNKPQNMTSHDCVSVVRRATGVKRVGHTGTLDPMATGVLPICIGSATRIAEYLDGDQKTYRCLMQLGIDTDTLDIWGNVTAERRTDNITAEAIADAVASFQGDIIQIPPKYSALKVAGKRLYQYAREGKEVEIKPRHIFVSDMTLNQIDENKVTFTVTCSKGTYIRSICRDIGEKLGCGAAMAGLERLGTGMFALENAVTLEEIRTMTPEEIKEILVPIDAPLAGLACVRLDLPLARDFTNGKSLADESFRSATACGNEEKLVRVYYQQEFIGVGKLQGERLTADKVFNTRLQHEDF